MQNNRPKDNYVYEDKSDLPCQRESVGRFRALLLILGALGVLILCLVSLLAGVVIGEQRAKNKAQYLVTFVQGQNRDPFSNFSDLLQEARASMVQVEYRTAGGEENAVDGLVLSESGYVVTGYRMLDGATLLEARFGDESERVDARLVAGDEQSDLAVLQVKRTGLMPVQFCPDDPHQGDYVVMMGKDAEDAVAVEDGYLTDAEEADRTGGEGKLVCMQRCTAGKAVAGGALYNLSGQLVGYVPPSMSEGDANRCYALSAGEVRTVAYDLIRDGYVRGRVDTAFVQVREYDGEDGPVEAGVYVSSVRAPASPIRQGDRILTLDGAPVSGIRDWLDNLSAHRAGDHVKVGVKRGGVVLEIELELEEKGK